MADDLCGAPHARYPETVCTEPPLHRMPHGGPLIVDGTDCGGASWGDDHGYAPETPDRTETGPTIATAQVGVVVREDSPADAPFGIDGCTCRPWTRQTNPPRYLDRPGDTVDMIGGWERGVDCAHHAEEQPDLRQRIADVIHGAGGTFPHTDADILTADIMGIVQPPLDDYRWRSEEARAQLHLIDGMRQNNLDAAGAAVQRAEEAEAAIARVREACDREPALSRFMGDEPSDWERGYAAAQAAIETALEGMGNARYFREEGS